MKQHIICMLAISGSAFAAPIKTTEALVAAAQATTEGSTIELAAGTYALSQPLDLNSGVKLKGAGIGKTIITNA